MKVRRIKGNVVMPRRVYAMATMVTADLPADIEAVAMSATRERLEKWISTLPARRVPQRVVYSVGQDWSGMIYGYKQVWAKARVVPVIGEVVA